MVPAFSPLAGGVSVSATGSSVSGTITVPALANALYIVNTSATLYVGVAYGVGGAPTATLPALTIPPMGCLLIEIPQGGIVTHVAAIGSAAGPTAVTFAPAYVQR
jgi:hypothetical protein